MTRGRMGRRGGIVPEGERIRRALEWLSAQGRHDPAAVEEACRRYDLTPREEQFLLEAFRDGRA